MTTSRNARVLALAGTALAGLLLAPMAQAEAKGRGARTALVTGTTSGPSTTRPAPIVRDHRAPRWPGCRGYYCPPRPR